MLETSSLFIAHFYCSLVALILYVFFSPHCSSVGHTL